MSTSCFHEWWSVPRGSRLYLKVDFEDERTDATCQAAVAGKGVLKRLSDKKLRAGTWVALDDNDSTVYVADVWVLFGGAKPCKATVSGTIEEPKRRQVGTDMLCVVAGKKGDAQCLVHADVVMR